MKNFIVCGNYGITNLGDEALLDGILGFIRHVEPDADITVMSAHPEETIKFHKVKSVAFVPSGFRSLLHSLCGGFGRTFRAIKKADIFILGGGGLFTDEKLRAVLIWYLQARFALFLKKPLFCLGQSVGPLQTRFGRFLTKKIFKKAAFISVRDQLSFELLQQLKIERVEVLADPAFALSFERNNLERREKYVVLSVRPWLKKEQKSQYCTLARFIDWLYEKHGLKSVLVPFQTLQDNDVEELEKIIDSLKYPESARISEYHEDYRKVLELISGAQAVVGMRLHSLIFATLTQTPFLALSYSQKVSGFVKDLELEDYLLEWKNLELMELQEKFELLEKNREKILIRLREKKKIFGALTRRNEIFLEKLNT